MKHIYNMKLAPKNASSHYYQRLLNSNKVHISRI